VTHSHTIKFRGELLDAVVQREQFMQ
jgi:hypothetical protein